jgi:hypothetical protein
VKANNRSLRTINNVSISIGFSPKEISKGKNFGLKKLKSLRYSKQFCERDKQIKQQEEINENKEKIGRKK